jgi:hypothetical protein
VARLLAVLLCLAGVLAVLAPWADAPTRFTDPRLTPAGRPATVHRLTTLYGHQTWEGPAAAAALLGGLVLSLAVRRLSPASRVGPAVLAGAALLALAFAAWGATDDHGEFFASDPPAGLFIDAPSPRAGAYVTAAAAAALALVAAVGLVAVAARRGRPRPTP